MTVVEVGHVRMTVHDPSVTMDVGMASLHGLDVGMVVMTVVVAVLVLVLHIVVSVLVLVG